MKVKEKYPRTCKIILAVIQLLTQIIKLLNNWPF